ncbi:MAG: hypothetical protein FWH12_01535 [Treponema sp.]|nr:hypothetical protein [Treponema sp.]
MNNRSSSLSTYTYIILCLCLLSGPLYSQAPQTEWFVSATGDDQLDGTWGLDLASVQRAISLIRRAYAAQPFDTATINIHGMIRNYGPDATDIAMVTLRGGGLPAIIFRGESTGSGLDAGGRLMVLYIENTRHVTVENLIITGGYANIGGGAMIISNSFTLGPGGVIEGNTATSFGGGLSVWVGDLTISGGTRIANNTAANGGGLGIAESQARIHGDAIIEGNTANENGGGIQIQNSNRLTIEDGAIIRGNIAGISGGGIISIRSPIVINGARIEGNRALRGGGILIDRLANLNQEGGVITGNTPSDVEEGT